MVRAVSFSGWFIFASAMLPSVLLHYCMISYSGYLPSSSSYSNFLARQNNATHPVRVPMSLPDINAFEISVRSVGHFSG